MHRWSRNLSDSLQPTKSMRPPSEFPQTLQTSAMRRLSGTPEPCSVQEEGTTKPAPDHRSESAAAAALPSVLSSAVPPSLWEEVSGAVRENVCAPAGRRTPSPSPAKRAASALVGLFPVLRWGRSYDLKMFRCDLMAGLTLASLGIPQGIGYASLAKLDPQYGLYTSVVPPLIYAVMGSSKEIAIGPVAVVSLLISSMVQRMADPSVDPIGYRNLVFTVTFFAGLFQAAFGFFRLGFLVDFLSHAAIVGFMGGAAIVIGLQQLKGLLGTDHFTNKTDVISVIKAVWKAVHQPWHPYNFVLGCSFLIFLLTARFLGRRNKRLFWLPAIAPLLSVALSTLLVFAARLDSHGVKTIKNVKGGINPSSVKNLQLDGPHVGETAKTGLIIAVIALTEAIAVGRSFASVKGYHLDGNKEMVAMGFMNIAGSMSSCYTATGSFSRTAVNFSAGCRTAVSNIVMAATVVLALELLTRLLYYTPTAILASIILSALPGLIDAGEARYLWEVDKLDFLTCAGTFAGVLFGSVEVGLMAAVLISFARIVLSSIRPGVEILGKIPGTAAAGIFCSVRQYPNAVPVPGLLILRVDSSLLYFTNSNFIRDRVNRWVVDELAVAIEEAKEGMRALIIDLSNVMNIDTSGISALDEINKTLASLGLQIAIVNPGWHAVHKMKLAKFDDRIGKRFYLTVGEAVEACLAPAKDNYGG